MGFDPGDAPDELVENLVSFQGVCGQSAVEEMAAASMGNAVFDIRKLWDEARPQALEVTIPENEVLRGKIREEVRPSIFPWHRAAQAAEVSRKTWGLGPGPVSSEVFSDMLGVRPRELLSQDVPPGIPMTAGFWDAPGSGAIKVHLHRRPSTSRRFALARVVGACLDVETPEKLVPVSDAATQRQKFQRAFAQELLCPYSDLKEFIGDRTPDDPIIEDAADYFDVSPLLIKTTLVNKKMLDRWVMESDMGG